jgi:putative endopeptidase
MSSLRAQVLGGAIMAALAAVALATFGLAQTPSIALNTEIDPSIRPSDDFYAYANNRWIAGTPRPESVSRLDTTSMLRAKNARRVQTLIENSVPSPSTRLHQRNSGVAALVGNYYATRLDTAGIDARGLAPLASDLAAIAAIVDRRGVAAYLGQSLRLDDGTNQHTESLWGVWVHQNFHDPNHYAAHLVQGGSGLPDEVDYSIRLQTM